MNPSSLHEMPDDDSLQPKPWMDQAWQAQHLLAYDATNKSLPCQTLANKNIRRLLKAFAPQVKIEKLKGSSFSMGNASTLKWSIRLNTLNEEQLRDYVAYLAAEEQAKKERGTSSWLSRGERPEEPAWMLSMKEQVDEMKNLFVQGSFDGMTDSYDYHQGPIRDFQDRYGSSKYFHASLEHPTSASEVANLLAESLHKAWDGRAPEDTPPNSSRGPKPRF